MQSLPKGIRDQVTMPFALIKNPVPSHLRDQTTMTMALTKSPALEPRSLDLILVRTASFRRIYLNTLTMLRSESGQQPECANLCIEPTELGGNV